jgi:hypothetical protein
MDRLLILTFKIFLLIAIGLLPDLNAYGLADHGVQISIEQNRPTIYGFFTDDTPSAALVYSTLHI